MKKTVCDRCGVEFKYLNDVEFKPADRRVEDFILDRGGNYCRKCTIEMISEIQAILDKKDNYCCDGKEPIHSLWHFHLEKRAKIEKPKPSKFLIIGNDGNRKESINIDNFISYEIDKDTMSLTIEFIVNYIPCSYTIKLHERGAIGVTIMGRPRYTSDDRTDFLNGTLIRDVIDALNTGLASDDVEIDISRFVDQSALKKDAIEDACPACHKSIKECKENNKHLDCIDKTLYGTDLEYINTKGGFCLKCTWKFIGELSEIFLYPDCDDEYIKEQMKVWPADFSADELEKLRPKRRSK